LFPSGELWETVNTGPETASQAADGDFFHGTQQYFRIFSNKNSQALDRGFLELNGLTNPGDGEAAGFHAKQDSLAQSTMVCVGAYL
jgi:hypothetical protein